MWRRVFSTQHLQSVSACRRSLPRSVVVSHYLSNSTRSLATASLSSSPTPPPPFSRATSDADIILSKGKKSVEYVMPIATGHECEEIEAELQGRNILEIDYPVGPFGTKEAPAIVKSHYDKRIVGCPGGEGKDEHDVVWFWLKKGKPYECPVCSQYFMLEVVGPGGPPDGHGDDDNHH